LEALVGEQARDGVGGAATVEDDGHAGFHQRGDEAGDGEFLLGVALVAGDEIVFLGDRVGVDQRGAAVVAADNAAGLEVIEGAAHGRERNR